MIVDYYHDEASDTIEMAAFQARQDQFNTMTRPLNDEEFAFQNETDFEQNSYWVAYFNVIGSEEQWTEIGLNNVSYAKEATDFIISPEPDTEA